MAVKIRLMRVGKKKQPTYRVVVADGRSPRDGRFIEIIGQYAPRQEPSFVQIDAESALAWLRKGAQPTEQVQKLLTAQGVWAQYEAERSKPAVTKLSRRGYVTGKVEAGGEAGPRGRRAAAARARGRGFGAGCRRGTGRRGTCRRGARRRRRRGRRGARRGVRVSRLGPVCPRAANDPWSTHDRRRRAPTTTTSRTRSAPRATASPAPAPSPSPSTSPATWPTTPTRSRSTSRSAATRSR